MKAYHTIVVGDSGAGKTTLLREIHAEFAGYSVWIDHNGVSGIDGRAGEGYTTVSSVAELKAANGTHIRYQCSDPVKAVGAIRGHLKGVYDRTGWPVQVVIDEAHAALPDSDKSAAGEGHPVAKMLHEDRDDGLKVVLGTQDPTEFYYPPIKQAAYIVWCGAPSPFHDGFARYYSLPKSELPTENFQYVVFEKGSAFNWSVAFRGETKASFG